MRIRNHIVRIRRNDRLQGDDTPGNQVADAVLDILDAIGQDEGWPSSEQDDPAEGE